MFKGCYMKTTVKIGIIFAMILLFFPSILVSCEGSKVHEPSTVEIALGMSIEDGEVVNDEDIPINVFAIAVIVFLVIALVNSFKTGKENLVAVMMLLAFLSQIAILIFFRMYYGIEDDSITVEPTKVWYISIVLYFVLMILSASSANTEDAQTDISLPGPWGKENTAQSGEVKDNENGDTPAISDEKLKTLEDLYKRGIITEEEFKELTKQ